MQSQMNMQTQRQNEMQEQLLQYQREFENRMQTLLLSNTKKSPKLFSSVLQATSQLPNDTTPALNDHGQPQIPIDQSQAPPSPGVGEAFSPEPKQPYFSTACPPVCLPSPICLPSPRLNNHSFIEGQSSRPSEIQRNRRRRHRAMDPTAVSHLRS